MNKLLKELNLEDDFLFAKVMNDKAICKELLESLLDIKIEKVIMLQEQKVIDLFNAGRHKYTFKNVCIEDKNIVLNDESQKILLNTKGSMNDISLELLEFLEYIENSTEDIAKKSRSNLVKNIHNKVEKVKNDISTEVEFMTLLERDREKIEEGIEQGIFLTKKVINLSSKGYTIKEIAIECNISEIEVKKILE